jgi:hypothetical protein
MCYHLPFSGLFFITPHPRLKVDHQMQIAILTQSGGGKSPLPSPFYKQDSFRVYTQELNGECSQPRSRPRSETRPLPFHQTRHSISFDTQPISTEHKQHSFGAATPSAPSDKMTSQTTSGTTPTSLARLSLRRFTCFPRLPKELQLEIWRCSLPGPRVVKLRYGGLGEDARCTSKWLFLCP